MTEQTAIVVGEDLVLASGPCGWCATPTTTRIVLEKERYRLDRGVRVVAKRAIEAWVCPEHERTLVKRHIADPAPGMVIKDA